ncbi:MAG: iron-containing alcohol dehydrogenase [Candidatus Hinthialibacter antarcticus]|nr:iron-containing alcohol dehydrogenase [Candidatus Hinthialibacter antarcticus]
MKIETIGFDHHNRVRLVFGNGAVSRLGERAKELGGTRVLLVTDPGLIQAGHPQRAEEALNSAGLDVTVFSQTVENPTTECVERCVNVGREAKVDLIVGLGGGSSLDTAKGCNFLLTNGGRMQDYWGVGKATKPMLPLIAVPTTAGTGSECQSFALISDAETHVKMACGDPKAAPRISVLDPELTLSQPKLVTARTGMDAITHAVETAVTKKRNAVSWLYSRESFRLTQLSYEQVLSEPDNQDARAAMLLGAAYAGIAIENSMLGAAHAVANPLTAQYHLVHGQAVGMMLPHVVRWNAQDSEVRKQYAELALFAGVVDSHCCEEDAVERLAQRLEQLLDAAGMPRSLSEFNVQPEDVHILAEAAAQQWTGSFNPRDLTVEDFQQLYRHALTTNSATV